MFDLTTYVKKWRIRQLKTVFSTLDTLCPERSCSSSRNRSSYSERRRGGLRWNNIMVPVGRGRAASQHLTLSLWILYKILYKKVLFKITLLCQWGGGGGLTKSHFFPIGPVLVIWKFCSPHFFFFLISNLKTKKHLNLHQKDWQIL